tara:strand:+ start:103 stop:465 length:363 start_codon:yes stop_codon:yes gene_type:complete
MGKSLGRLIGRRIGSDKRIPPFVILFGILSYILGRSNPSFIKFIKDKYKIILLILFLILIANLVNEGFENDKSNIKCDIGSSDPCCNEPSKELFCSNINVGREVSNELWDKECGSTNPCP